MSLIAKAGTATTTVYGRQIQAVSAPWSECGWRLLAAGTPRNAPTVAALFQQNLCAEIVGNFTARRCGTPTANTDARYDSATANLKASANAQHLTFTKMTSRNALYLL